VTDLQVIEIRDLLKVTSYAYVANSNPPSMLIRGVDFSSAQEVFINEAKSPDVVVTSMNVLLAQIPETQINSPIRSLIISSSRLTRTDRSHIVFRIGDTPSTVDGLTRLIQMFLKLMLQSPGTDIFSKLSGGGMLGALGKLMTNPSSSSLVADFNLSVSRARQQILALQARNPKLSMSERLLYARVISAKYNPSELALYGQIAIGNQVGKGSVVGLGL